MVYKRSKGSLKVLFQNKSSLVGHGASIKKSQSAVLSILHTGPIVH